MTDASEAGTGPTGPRRTAFRRALPLIGCGAVLGILAVMIVQTSGRALLVVLALLLALALTYALLFARHRLAAVHRFRQRYGAEGKDLLIVYTASPHWQEYIEREWLPRWGARAVVLNRSKPWEGGSPEANLWFAYKTGRQHTPLAVVVPRRGRPRVVRFFNAFRDYKHGKDAPLRAAERQLEAALDASRG